MTVEYVIQDCDTHHKFDDAIECPFCEINRLRAERQDWLTSSAEVIDIQKLSVSPVSAPAAKGCVIIGEGYCTTHKQDAYQCVFGKAFKWEEVAPSDQPNEIMGGMVGGSIPPRSTTRGGLGDNKPTATEVAPLPGSTPGPSTTHQPEDADK